MRGAPAAGAESPADLVAELVRLESVNPDLDPSGAGEGAIVDFLADWLRQRGLEVTVVEPSAGRPSLVATLPGSGTGPSLLLTGHVDTVALAGEWAGREPRVVDGRLYGRGAYDMKGGLAAVLMAVDRIRSSVLAGDLVVAAVADEESLSVGTRAILDELAVDAAIVTEPTGLEIAVAHKGFAWATVTATGVAAHGSRPDLGRDAILAMAPVLTRLSELSAELTANGRRHPLLGAGSVHASTINGGTGYSTYPASCELTLERRTVPGETIDDVEEELRGLVGAADQLDGVEVAGKVDLWREPFAAPEPHPILDALSDAAGRVRGQAPRRIGYAPWTDAALLAAAGIPTLVFGPGGGGAHADREWVELADVAACAEILRLVATEFCGEEPR